MYIGKQSSYIDKSAHIHRNQDHIFILDMKIAMTICWHTILVYLCHRSRICSVCRNRITVIFTSFKTCHRLCNVSNTTNATSINYFSSGALAFIISFSGVRVARYLVFCLILSILFICLYVFFFWSMHCLSLSIDGFWIRILGIQTFRGI